MRVIEAQVFVNSRRNSVVFILISRISLSNLRQICQNLLKLSKNSIDLLLEIKEAYRWFFSSPLFKFLSKFFQWMSSLIKNGSSYAFSAIFIKYARCRDQASAVTNFEYSSQKAVVLTLLLGFLWD